MPHSGLVQVSAEVPESVVGCWLTIVVSYFAKVKLKQKMLLTFLHYTAVLLFWFSLRTKAT